MQKPSYALCAAVIFLIAAPAFAQSGTWRGRVQKEGARLARPQLPLQATEAPLPSGISTDGFMLKADSPQINASFDIDWPSAWEQPRRAYLSASPRQSERPTVGPNYAAIERAYAESGAPFQISAAPRGARRLAADNCACHSTIPSTSCTVSRMQGFGTNVQINTNWPTVTLQTARPSVAPPTMHQMR